MGTGPVTGAVPAPTAPAGSPRSEQDAAFLARFEARMRTPIIVSAILPLLIAPEAGNWVGVLVGVATWVVFLVDFVVHTRRLHHYTSTGLGRFDLAVVVLTAPWFLLPGAQAGGFVVLLRLARLARLVMASRGAKTLFQRIGRIALLALGVVLVAALVAYHAEHPTNPEFATVGDALWWGIVTLTTVGYGDIVPKTPTGRWAGVMIMVTGIAVLGVLAGSLASFFRLDQEAAPGGAAPAGPGDVAPAAVAPESPSVADVPLGATGSVGDTGPLETLVDEIAALRRQVDWLSARLVGDVDHDDER
ncbi:MAG TPA: ion channel [Acidimicrobiales bacterium]|nr:ion channel [Acidimicrobiales bacterium]